jgi:hypothetical protein
MGLTVFGEPIGNQGPQELFRQTGNARVWGWGAMVGGHMGALVNLDYLTEYAAWGSLM